ncbi:MAG TPA: hypothetical protein VJ698_19085 [Noviherbaspirillum sp.]|uniref:hypothetical protein n=1 Tax=Noviherbaspirillum sp. TaxID=1926288 RepID=UPI002B492ED7|nr:hypothetical protein [Noviherbaspirillum sp.]HJV87581.1 hypothetical protein [Noviherbaspirillum sp.]
MGGIITQPILVLCYVYKTHKTQQAVNPQLNPTFRFSVNHLERREVAVKASGDKFCLQEMMEIVMRRIPPAGRPGAFMPIRNKHVSPHHEAQIIHICKEFFMSEK